MPIGYFMSSLQCETAQVEQTAETPSVEGSPANASGDSECERVMPANLNSWLPAEILRVIFVLCTLEPAALAPNINEPRLAIIQVCSQWRVTAIGTCELWSNVILMPSRRRNPLRDSEMVKDWLARGGETSLSLRTWVPSYGYLRGWKWAVDPIKDIIIPYAHRIRTLFLTLPCQEVKALFLFPSGSFPMLEDIDLVVGYRTTDRDSGWSYAATPFQSTPRLRNAIMDLPGKFDLRVLRLPWSQLRKLHLLPDPLPGDLCCSVLRECHLLEDLSLRIEEIDDVVANRIRAFYPVALPLLHTVEIVFRGAANFMGFLRSLVLSVIRSFELYCDAQLQWSPMFYVELLGSSWTRLERFRIQDEADLGVWKRNPSLDIGILLESMPRLKVLHVFPTNMILDSTLAKLSSGEYVSSLESWKLAVHPDQVCAVIAVLEERHRSLDKDLEAAESSSRKVGQSDAGTLGQGGRASRLRSVQLIYPTHTLEPSVSSRLHRLRKDGVDIQTVSIS